MLTLGKITLLAIADSINPCAIAVLAMILMSILIQNPDKKKKVLLGGLSFIAAVFIGYFIYGTIIIQLFQTLSVFLKSSSIYIYKALAILAMLFGALNIKDALYYKKGSFGTEMPLFMRPKVKKLTNKITSPKGAFIIGLFVTLFLLPCTIGPYVIVSGLLAEIGFLAALPLLIYYNILFVIPMLIIIFLVYWGFAKIDEVSGWKERNIKRLHLVAGILLFLVGLTILFGWI
jgi:cytochrome c biogenesis protein CcdA